MKPEKKRFINTFRLALLMIVLASSSISLIPFADFDGIGGVKTLAYAIGAFFWLFFITGYSLFSLANKQRKVLVKTKGASKTFKKGIAVFCFFQTGAAKIADITFFALGFLYFLLTIFKAESDTLKIEVVVLVILFFQLHCVFNGKNFKLYIKIKNRRDGNE